LSTKAQRALSSAYSNLGDLHSDLGETEAALENYGKALEIRRKLAGDDRSSVQAQEDLLLVCKRLVVLHINRWEYSEAARWCQQGLDWTKHVPKSALSQEEIRNLNYLLRFCQAVEPAVADPASALQQPEEIRFWVLSQAACLLARRRNLDKAIGAAELLIKEGKTPGDVYNAACAYALCVLAVDKDEDRERYAARAVALLRQAVDQGYEDADHLAKDKDLAALRERPDFQKLLADLADKQKK
jgi:hypothetical protein